MGGGVSIEVAVRPRPCLGCAMELVLRIAPLRRGVRPTPVARSGGGGGAPPPVALGCHRHPPLPQQPELHSLSYYAAGDEVPLGRFIRALLRQLVHELLKSGPEFPVLAEGQRLHPAQLVELPLPRPHHRRSCSYPLPRTSWLHLPSVVLCAGAGMHSRLTRRARPAAPPQAAGRSWLLLARARR
jgi:hypothetical protein